MKFIFNHFKFGMCAVEAAVTRCVFVPPTRADVSLPPRFL
jgi:hypothetical protein